jgi:hypothetical protein
MESGKRHVTIYIDFRLVFLALACTRNSSKHML